ncbi:hypothetical protein Tco_0953884, partial [Tanacetum coccineum]
MQLPNTILNSHSLFMELSRFLVVGVPELPFANFLHRISTTESGYVEEQMELFLTNKQKLLKLPSEESKWSMYSISSPEEDKLTPTISSGFSLDVLSPAYHQKEDEALKDQSSSRIHKDIVSSDTNDGFTSNERELVALNSEKRGKRCVKKVKEFGSASDFVTEGKDDSNEEESAEKIIECIRREEFGIHVRNADENMYLCDVEPTLTFILQETGVIVLNNDQGFSVETIKALCKVGNSSKTEPSTGYISKKGISFKSAFQEVDAHSPWNQWLLMEFPKLFVNAELSICSLTCFKENPAKGISVFMSFVPLEGEVHGFFSQLPHMIIYKLCSSSCLLLQGEDNEWVTPCKVLRNWTEETRLLLPDSLIREHLDVGYLHKDTLLTDSLARALGIEECGPKVLIQVMASLCQADSLKSMGLDWLSSWLNVLFLMLVNATEYDFISSFSQLPIIPILDGNYASINEGAIWFHTDPEHGLEAFGKLYSKLRIVNPALFSDHVENITQMLYKVGVQRLSAHEVLKKHVLPAICDEKVMAES